MLDYP
jgi:hypothetical protein